MLAISFFTDGTFFLFLSFSQLTEDDIVLQLADASLHTASLLFEKIRFSVSLSFLFLFFLKTSVLGLAAGHIQVFRLHILLCFSMWCTMVMQLLFMKCYLQLRTPLIVSLLLFHRLLPQARCSVVLVPYIVASCLICCCSCTAPQRVCPQTQGSHELTFEFQRLGGKCSSFLLPCISVPPPLVHQRSSVPL